MVSESPGKTGLKIAELCPTPLFYNTLKNLYYVLDLGGGRGLKSWILVVVAMENKVAGVWGELDSKMSYLAPTTS